MALPGAEIISVGGKQFQVIDKLGEGAFGIVKLGHDITNPDKKVALKVMMLPDNNAKREKLLSSATLEIKAMREMRHPNVIQLYGYDLQTQVANKDAVVLVQEYAKHGELFEHVTFQKFDEDMARYIFREVMNGIKACHDAGIAHRDLKPANILLDKKFNVKIIDFGLASFFVARESEEAHNMRTVAGTQLYMAPEVRARQPYNEKCDIFSAGVLLFILIAAYPPYGKAKDWWYDKLQKGHEHNGYSLFWQGHERRFNFPETAREVIQSCLAFNVETRWSAEECLECDWLQNGAIPEKKKFRRIMYERHTQIKQKKLAESPGRIKQSQEMEKRNRDINPDAVHEELVVFPSDFLTSKWRLCFGEAETRENIIEILTTIVTEEPTLQNILECTIPDVSLAIQELPTLLHASDYAYVLGTTEELAQIFVDKLNETDCGLDYNENFPKFMEFEEQYPLKEFHLHDSPTTYPTKFGYSTLCAVLNEYMAPQEGECHVDPENRAVDLVFNVLLTEEYPNEDGGFDPHEIPLEMVISAKLYKQIKDGTDEHIHNKLVLQNTSEDFRLSESYAERINEITALPDWIYAQVSANAIGFA